MDLNKLAEDLSQLSKGELQELNGILKQDHNGVVIVLHKDVAISDKGISPADQTGPGTGPGH